ncbi:MAG: chemotaxis-specific protein-glutamate methyltransferase CheB [Spirochaetes bacterium]|nr:chemotaxis-specific protein-glutamate methyltransferase CheB [Spirochaetota bacterium]
MKIMIVDDSVLLRGIIKQILLENSDVETVIEATNGKIAIEKNMIETPDLIIMDINMPVMDGISATREIMQQRPVPVMIFSSKVDAANSFTALKYGAVDVMSKPNIEQLNNPEFYKRFIEKLYTLATALQKMPRDTDSKKEDDMAVMKGYDMIVMGASTGGPMAIASIIRRLPAGFPRGIVIVQHLETGFEQSFAQWLNLETPLTVRLAVNDDYPAAGEVLIAPALRHLVFKGRRLFLDDGPKVQNQKPSADILFTSAAVQFKERLIGVLLTGMGRDGAQGCVDIKRNGGITLVQDADTSTIFGMPKCAIQLGGASRVLPLDKITDTLVALTAPA